jgi:hypothetical protein
MLFLSLKPIFGAFAKLTKKRTACAHLEVHTTFGIRIELVTSSLLKPDDYGTSQRMKSQTLPLSKQDSL